MAYYATCLEVLVARSIWRGKSRRTFDSNSRDRRVIQGQFASALKKERKGVMDSFDKFLKPLILCPWGCTEYYHRCGYIGFDLILQQHFQHLDIPLISGKGKFSKASSSRLDFLKGRSRGLWVLINESRVETITINCLDSKSWSSFCYMLKSWQRDR